MIAALALFGPALFDVGSVETAGAAFDVDPIVRSAAFAYRLYESGGEPPRRSR